MERRESLGLLEQLHDVDGNGSDRAAPSERFNVAESLDDLDERRVE